jgi:hypothetical protein
MRDYPPFDPKICFIHQPAMHDCPTTGTALETVIHRCLKVLGLTLDGDRLDGPKDTD